MLILFGIMAALFLLAERFFPLRSQPIFREGFFVDCVYVLLHYAMRVIFNGTIAVMISGIGQGYFPDSMFRILANQPLGLQIAAVLLVHDFIFYITHRLKHRWHWWWRLHETHHSSREMDFLSHVRFHPLEKILDRTIYLLPLLFFGVSEKAIFIWAGIDVFLGMLNHSNLNWRIGPLIYIFSGPEMHHWHHVRHAGIRECKYGGNFSIFDWIFGTAFLSREKPGEYGVEDAEYPQGDIMQQFFYAFRPSKRSSKDLQQPLGDSKTNTREHELVSD
jgi:sterol desaturase/sphingolipid hydroxylase (fatty acid hydroxylase superfamily)